MPFEIAFESLWTHGETDEPVSLTFLSDENTHVHGKLRIVVRGCELPRLGFFGPDDVCFNAWVHELTTAARVLVAADPAAHVFDEGEQGQPAYHFERAGSDVFVSVRASMISDGTADPSWERVPCKLEEFVVSVSRFVAAFSSALEALAGEERAESWWKQFAEGSA